MNSLLTKSYVAGAAVNPYRFCKNGAADGTTIQATDASAAILGVSEGVPAEAAASVDLIKVGIAFLELGGVVARGNVLIPDANGKGVAAVVVAGTAQYVGAVAEVSGVAGDIIPVLVTPGAVIATDTGIATAEVTLSSAQMLALNATPRELIPAPGAGKAILVEDAQVFLDYNSAAYAGVAAGEDLEIRYTDGSGALIATVETDPFLTSVADAYRHVRPVTTAAHLVPANAAVVIRLASGEITTGNSPVKVRIRYRTVDVAW